MKIIDRLNFLSGWLFDERSRNFKDAQHQARIAKTFPFSLRRHGTSPDKEEYIAFYNMYGKHARQFSITYFILEREKAEANPNIYFTPGNTVTDKGEQYGRGVVIKIASHAIDRYMERYFKTAGATATVEQLNELLDSLRQASCNVDPVTYEVTYHTEHGLFLGRVDQVLDIIDLKTFVADHNLYRSQSLEKRKLRDFREKMNDRYTDTILSSVRPQRPKRKKHETTQENL